MTGPIFLPALQGQFGSWLYYTALMSLTDLKDRVSYATEIHENKKLADWIQRRLDNKNRRRDIAEFLLKNKDRFFNALVVGVHGGDPQWHPFDVDVRNARHQLDEIRDQDREAVGYLELAGTEKLFALDGQHRLAGVREALTRNPSLGVDRVSVIFVSAKITNKGLLRTRDLFIMLNKHAAAVKKPDIIALDEVDLSAIITRRLVDSHPWFSCGQIDLNHYGNSMPKGDRKHLTTLGNLYDVIATFLKKAMAADYHDELKDAARLRLAEDRIDFFQDAALQFFQKLAKVDSLLDECFKKADPDVLERARNPGTPHVLFRPIGLLIFAKVIGELRKKFSLSESYDRLREAPLLLTASSYNRLIWDETRANILTKGAATAVMLLAFQLGADIDHQKLRSKYAELLGEPPGSVRLPARILK